MSAKFHINKHGVPALCEAKKRNCPLGTHYNSEEEAAEAINREHEENFGLLGITEIDNNEEVLRRKNLADLIQRISGIKSTGFDYECFASVSVAEQMGLNKVAITDDNGLVVNLSINDDNNYKSLNADIYVERSIQGLHDYYSKLGLPVKDEKLLARIVYYNENESTILVQSGGPNVLDAAIIKADEVVDIIEVKELERGAQLPLISIDVEKDGTMNKGTIEKQSKYIQEALKNVNIQDVDGTNLVLDFGNEDNNRKAPLYHFINEYKKKGATSFIYTTNNGEEINKIDLTRDEKEVVKDMLNKGIEAKVILRGNLHKQNATEHDIQRFNNIVSKKYFKSRRTSNTESFTLKSIEEDKISKSGEYVRIGGFVLPIKYEDYKDNLNKRIKKTDMKSFKFSLTGSIKTSY